MRGYSNTSSSGSSCSECEPGTYKTSIGTGACLHCDVYSYNPNYGGDFVGSCLPCPGGSVAGATGSRTIEDCICIAGYGLDGYCKPCAPGQYSTNVDRYCINCPANTFSSTPKATSSDTCLPCPTNSATNGTGHDQSTDCNCNLGFYGLAGASCSECQPGSYSDSLGPEPCTL